MIRYKQVAVLAGFVFLSGCVTTKDYTAFLSANPRAILVVPVVNQSVDVNAADYFLSTLSVPLAERGYYVFPVNLVKRLLEDDGLADASMVHAADTSRLCSLFGADAVLYVTITKWQATYMIFTTQVAVEFDYLLKDGKTGTELWKEHKKMVYVPPQSQAPGLIGLIANTITAAMTKAAPNYMPLARRANTEAFAWPGPGLPAGPYLPEYRKDLTNDR